MKEFQKRLLLIGLEVAVGATACNFTGPPEKLEDKCRGYPLANVWDVYIDPVSEFQGEKTQIKGIEIVGNLSVEPVQGTYKDKRVVVGHTYYKPQDGLMMMDGSWETMVQDFQTAEDPIIVANKYLGQDETPPATLRICITPKGEVFRNYYPDTP